MKPPVTGKGAKVYEDAVSLPPRVPTTNRANMKKLVVPEIQRDGSFDFTIPGGSKLKLDKVESLDFEPVRNRATTITASYADSVQWNNDKIARDVLQNFYDGHNQTLDGVRIISKPVKGGKYRIRIEGHSSYTADKALYIGESTKRADAKAAGNYGEGLKMSALKILKDCGADNVKIASDNWQLTYKILNGNLGDKKVLAYS